ncbi:hypothetical protein [Micromonospora sp. NPDC050200]|uniref:hypothetical protein n=1 Tax=Micromonospora sp. NPDC050200 TaxID=3155664 RepID=UPI0033DC3FA7
MGAEHPTADAAATITPHEDGPLLVRGDFALVTRTGAASRRGGARWRCAGAAGPR